MAARLEAAGARVETRDDLGSATIYRALAAGEIDVYVDYSGTLWANVLERTDNPGRAAVLAGLRTELARRDGVLLLGPLGFENAYALAMSQDRARALGIASLDDLARRSSELTLGSDLEFLSRPEWRSVKSAYGLDFKKLVSYQPTFMYAALRDGEVDAISAFSSDGRIEADHLLVLTDPKRALPPYDAVLLISPRRAHDARLIAALKPLIGAIDVSMMRQANYSVDRQTDKATPAAAAARLNAKIATGTAGAR
jgi:osmoprotectant transport system permease protein